MSPKTQVGISAVARAVGVSEGEVRRLANDGTIQSSRDHANRRVFDASVIDVLKARAKRIEAKRRAKATA
jgi:DNA-binding transcriptional MerR regulator